MADQTTPRYRYWGECKPVALARPAETVQMAAAGGKKTAQIRLYGPIDSWGAPFGVAASEVASALDSVGSADVEMHVHSPGGDAFEGFAIMNLLRQHAGDVHIVVDGMCASAASIVAMGASKVTMVPGSTMMVHDASALAIGQAVDMRQAADMLDHVSGNAADMYAAKAGGTSDDWRTRMQPESWFKAQQAVDVGLADEVLPESDPKTATARAAAAALTFDLSMFAHPPVEDEPRCHCGMNGRDVSTDPSMEHKDDCPTRASQAPAAPADGSITHERSAAVAFTDEQLTTMRQQLGLASDADETAIVAAQTEALAERADPSAVHPAIPAEPDAATVAAALAKDGKVAVSQTFLDEIKSQAAEGVKARRRQLDEDRDDAIKAAVSAGKISRDRAEHWSAYWDKDPEGAKAELDQLEARFPVGKPLGHQDGGENASAEVMTDDEAGALAALSGTSKEALING